VAEPANAGVSPTIVSQEPAQALTKAVSGNPRILIVEDAALVLMDIVHVISALGWEVVGPATRLADALKLAQEATFDAALVGNNLDGEMSWDATAILQDRNIPFVFTTGYDGSTVLPERFARQKILNKPFGADDIKRELHTLLS
jgi:CheY-like chemotaxis protein